MASDGPDDHLEAYLAKLDKTGRALWIQRFAKGDIQGLALAVGADGASVLGGSFSRSFRIGGRMIEHPGRTKDADVFFARFAP
jgi:hypothetical protein